MRGDRPVNPQAIELSTTAEELGQKMMAVAEQNMSIERQEQEADARANAERWEKKLKVRI